MSMGSSPTDPAYKRALWDGISYSALFLVMPAFDYAPIRSELRRVREMAEVQHAGRR